MAKRRKRRSEDTTRDALDIATAPVRSVLLKRESLLDLSRRNLLDFALRELEDRRTFSPEIFRPARAVSRQATQVVVPKQRFRKKPRAVTSAMQFRVPANVALCARRHQRREVIFATGRAGGSLRQRPARWSEYSHINCK